MAQMPLYGVPCVTDPNDFIPDGACCSPVEIEAHRLACANYGKPSYQPNKGCFTEFDESGQLALHVLRTSWGIGTNLIASCDGCAEPFFSDTPIVCHECHEQEFCDVCWPKHEAWHEGA